MSRIFVCCVKKRETSIWLDSNFYFSEKEEEEEGTFFSSPYINKLERSSRNSMI